MVGVTLRCTRCRGAVELVDDNGVTDPDEGDRFEIYRCVSCGGRGSLTIPADERREIRSGVLSEVV